MEDNEKVTAQKLTTFLTQCPTCGRKGVMPDSISISPTWIREDYRCRCGQEWIVRHPQ